MLEKWCLGNDFERIEIKVIVLGTDILKAK